MKTPLFLISAIFIAVAMSSEDKPKGFIADVDNAIVTKATTGSLFITDSVASAVITMTSDRNVIFFDVGESLRIEGLLKHGEPPPSDVPRDGIRVWSGDRYPRPEKPDDVTVIVTTKDGKRWRATWVRD